MFTITAARLAAILDQAAPHRRAAVLVSADYAAVVLPISQVLAAGEFLVQV